MPPLTKKELLEKSEWVSQMVDLALEEGSQKFLDQIAQEQIARHRKEQAKKEQREKEKELAVRN